MNTPKETLIEIDEIGPKIADSLYLTFNSDSFINMITTFYELGLIITPIPQTKKGPLSGKTVVITGTLSSCSRETAIEKIATQGGKVTTSISKKLDYLLIGDNPGSKLEKAKEAIKNGASITLISESEFLNLIK